MPVPQEGSPVPGVPAPATLVPTGSTGADPVDLPPADLPTVADLPMVELFALGGTIASLPSGEGVTPKVTGEQLVRAVPALEHVARVEATQFLQVPSCELTVGDLALLVEVMRAAVDAGAAGCVVTQGTDTLEETTFVLDLLWDRAAPVVVTGAMRSADQPGADGPANLLSAVRVAASSEAVGAGVLAVLGDEVHAGRHVRKSHTWAPSAFTSPGLGPVGGVAEGRVRLPLRPVRVPGGLDTRALTARPLPRVVCLRVGMGEGPELLEAVLGMQVDGVVLEGVGGGHVPRALAPTLERLARRIPVLLCGRPGAGPALSTSYGYPGGDVDLVARGLVPAGPLDATKARLALVLGLATHPTREALEEWLDRTFG